MRKDLIPTSVADKYLASLTDGSFKIMARSTDEEVELLMHGAVGDGWDHLDSRSVASFLAKNRGKRVNLRINSPGGLVFDGIAIHNALLQHEGEVVAKVEGIAASAATVAMMAADRIEMFANATMMIHRAWGLTVGNRTDMADMIDVLDKIDSAIATTYEARTGKSKDEIYKLMDGKKDGTWFTAEEAVGEKFADVVLAAPEQGEAAEAEASTDTAVHHAVAVAAKSRIAAAVKVRARKVALDNSK